VRGTQLEQAQETICKHLAISAGQPRAGWHATWRRSAHVRYGPQAGGPTTWWRGPRIHWHSSSFAAFERRRSGAYPLDGGRSPAMTADDLALGTLGERGPGRPQAFSQDKPTTKLIVAARMTVPKRYESRACLSAADRMAEVLMSVSDT
jgi:hypothetical protein